MDEEYYNAVDHYMHGYCMFMAAALHHKYNYPIGILTITHDRERLSHCWVVAEDGYIDIQGVQTLDQVSYFKEDAQKWAIYCPTTLQELERFAGCKLPPDEPDVIQATKVLEKYQHLILK